MISIRKEIAEIEDGQVDRSDNVLKNAPHTAAQVIQTEWVHKYSREKAAFLCRGSENASIGPPVARINEVQGDRNLICSCPPIDSYK